MDLNEWDDLAEKFSHVTDRLGRPIDDGIFETVVALNALGITTTMSCEGHLDHGLAGPWVDIEVDKYVRRDTPETLQLRMQLWELTKEPEADRNQRQRANLQLRYRVFRYLEDFYRGRHVLFDRMIMLMPDGRIASQGVAYVPLLPETERAEKLRAYQDEMKRFTVFLKSIYFDREH